MENDVFYPELTKDGNELVQTLYTNFITKLKKVAKDVIEETVSEFYCDILPYIEHDSWMNFRNSIVNALQDYGNAPKHEYQFAQIRRKIFSEFKDEITNDVIKDLEKEIIELKQSLDRSRKLF